MTNKQAHSLVALVIAMAACGTKDRVGFDGQFSSNADNADAGRGVDAAVDSGPLASSPSFGGSGGTSPDAAPSCANLACKQVVCAGGADTTVSGVVHAPAKIDPDPLYNAIVYIPNAKTAAFPGGVSCEQCGALASGSPLVTALTGPNGAFSLKNVPVGENIPLVVQLGRWRRQVTIPKVTACQDTPLPDELTRLPRNQTEGDIPLHAISTGNSDALECVLRKIGIDDAEFTTSSGNGRIHLYESNGAGLPNIPPATTLWGDVATLKKYDIVVLDCEGAQNEKPKAAKDRMVEYTSAGGRIFASHYNFVWLYDTPPFSGTASWNPVQADPPDPLIGTIDTSFPKGQAFSTWLQLVGAETGPDQIAIHVPRYDADSVVAPSQRWISSSAPSTLQHYTFNTPVGAADDKQCGRVVFSDFHVTGARGDSGGQTFPDECDTGPLTPQEKVLEFMLFDLASCIQKDAVPPAPPPPAPVN